MKKMSIIVGVIIVVLLIGVWFMFRGGGKVQTISISKQALQANILPVIQILNPSVVIVGADGKPVRELADGEALTAPLHIQVGPKADAILVYIDGSSARLSPGADIKIERGMYDTTTGNIDSKISVISGHVWSKVEALATPESQWQVETPHAVATVRGTAFDTKVEDGKSTFTGSEHKVDIIPLDPDTGKEMKDKDADLDADKQIILGDKDMHDIKADKKDIESKKFDPAKSGDADWIDQNTKRDDMVDDLKNQGDSGKSMRDRLFDAMEGMKGSDDTKNPADNSTGSKDSKEVKDTTPTDTKKDTKAEVKVEVATSTAKISKVSFRIDIPKSVVERTKVPFTVIGTTSDGKEVDLTRTAKVSVIGGIGHITTPGVFVAELDADKTELGSVPGALAGEYMDPVSGVTLEFSTPAFNVSIFIDDTTETRG